MYNNIAYALVSTWKKISLYQEFCLMLSGDRWVENKTGMSEWCSPVQGWLGPPSEANQGGQVTIWGPGKGEPHLTNYTTAKGRGNQTTERHGGVS